MPVFMFNLQRGLPGGDLELSVNVNFSADFPMWSLSLGQKSMPFNFAMLSQCVLRLSCDGVSFFVEDCKCPVLQISFCS